MHTMINLLTYTSIALFYTFVLGVWALATYDLYDRVRRGIR